MNLPRAFTFNTDADWRPWPCINLLKGDLPRGYGWVLEIAWLKCQFDIYNLHAWNTVCDIFNSTTKDVE